MNLDDYKKFKIVITTKQHVPVHPKNPYLVYKQDSQRQNDRLLVSIFFDDVEIGYGLILDFYKQFEIVEGFGIPYTHPLNVRTTLGQNIFKIKYYKNPPISDSLKQLFIEKFAGFMQPYVESVKSNTAKPYLAYIPSLTQTPDLIAKELTDVTGVEIANIISKDSADTQDSKNIEEYFESMEHAQKKYIFDTEFISDHVDAQYIIIDDVMGLGSSILTSLKAIYDITGKMNYFLIVVKDVKR